MIQEDFTKWKGFWGLAPLPYTCEGCGSSDPTRAFLRDNQGSAYYFCRLCEAYMRDPILGLAMEIEEEEKR